MEDRFKERVSAAALGRIFGYEPLYVSGLVSKLGSAAAVFDLSPREADALLGPYSKYRGKICPAALDAACEELEALSARGFHYIACTETDFPALLLDCPDCPAGLYYISKSEPAAIFSGRPAVAVVGTRDISPYGREWTRKIVQTCAQAPSRPCIISGLAYGVDITAHLTALDCGIPTIAVLPCGIDSIYPWRHTELAMQMVRTPGCGLLTDYPLGTAPVALNFLRRNRIIAGLVRAVIVVESKSKGGSLMTARYAVDYSRDVYALPGRADDLRSAGCNSLIAHNMAQLITSPEELVGQLGLGAVVRGAGGSWGKGARSLERVLERDFGPGSTACAVALAVRDHRGATPDALTALTGLSIADVLEGIGLLEIRGIITTDLLRRCSLSPAYA